ncbi:hypothetical protein HDV01_000541 [Terramyces sp. JEL0728]|nr:hypothetical protein HDV01_000541 [Terramyces sp. JEL0728]
METPNSQYHIQNFEEFRKYGHQKKASKVVHLLKQPPDLPSKHLSFIPDTNRPASHLPTIRHRDKGILQHVIDSDKLSNLPVLPAIENEPNTNQFDIMESYRRPSIVRFSDITSIIPISLDRSEPIYLPRRASIIPKTGHIIEEPLPPIDISDGRTTPEYEALEEPIPKFLGRMSVGENKQNSIVGFEESKPLRSVISDGGFNSRISFQRNQPGLSRSKKVYQKHEKISYFLNLGCMILDPKVVSQRGDTHVLSPRHKWQFAIKTILKLIKSLGYHDGPYDMEIDPDPEKDIGANIILRLFKHQSQIALSTKIQQYYKRQKSLNRQETTGFYHILMNRLTFFSKLSYEQRVRLTHYFTYEFHKKGIPIIQKGTRASRVYFLLSGQCKEFKPVFDGEKETLLHSGYLDIGECIGQDNTEGTYQDPIFHDYWHILLNEDTKKDIKDRISLLKSIPVFSNADDSILEQSVSRTKIRYFDRYTQILTQGISNRNLFWVLSGKVRVDKQIQFLCNIAAPSLQRPDTTDTHVLRNERRVSETVSIGVLETNGSFPEPLPESFPHIEQGSDRLEFISKISDHDALQLNKSTVSVLAITPVVCLVIERIDFMRVMSWSMFDSLDSASLMYSVNVRVVNKGKISASSMVGSQTMELSQEKSAEGSYAVCKRSEKRQAGINDEM